MTAAAARGWRSLPLVAARCRCRPRPAAPSVEPPQCEVGKTRYVAESSSAMAGLSFPAVLVPGHRQGRHRRRRRLRRGLRQRPPRQGACCRVTSFVPGPPTEDLLGHGTGVAGIIAARYVQGSALIGAAPEAKILPVRVFQDEDSTGTQPVAFPPGHPTDGRRHRWAVRHGADVVNVSMSTRPTDAAPPGAQGGARPRAPQGRGRGRVGGRPGPGRAVHAGRATRPGAAA